MSREWYFQAMGQDLGPLSVTELKARVANGQIQKDTLVRKTVEGKWVFAAKVKGLFPTVEEEPPPPPPISINKGKPSATMPIVGFVEPRTKPGSSASIPVASSSPSEVESQSNATPTKFVPLSSMKLDEDEEDASVSKPPSVEFYHFVGFREAISPVLFDAVEQFVQKREMTMTQLNRRALAEFIQRPELASDLMITAVSLIPQPVGAKSNEDGSQPLSEKQQLELATFRFTLFNSGASPIHIDHGTFLPESIETREYDMVAGGEFSPISHTDHARVDLTSAIEGKALKVELDVTVLPQQTKDVVIWFHASNKPSFRRFRGQFLVGHGGELALSEYFTVVMHGDSPEANS